VVDAADEPLDHVARIRPPWVDEVVTECGRPLADVAGTVLTWQEYARKYKRLGQQRTAMTTCITCHNRQSGIKIQDRATMEIVDNWDDHPSGVIARWMGMGGYYSGGSRDLQINRDFRAIGQLIERHREEFELLRQPDEFSERRRNAMKEKRQATRRSR
jgi:hypothetical protein